MGETTAKPLLRRDLSSSDYNGADGVCYKIIHDPLAAKYYKLTKYEHDLLAAFDGQKDLKETIESLKRAGRFYAEEHAVEIANRAAKAGLLLGTSHTSAKRLVETKSNTDKVKRVKALSNLYFVYIPLVNPDKFLENTLWIIRPLLSKWAFPVIFALSCSAIYILLTSTERLYNNYLFFFNLNNLVILWAVIIVSKLAHELAHAYTAKRYGLTVPRMGVAFLVFMPCLYCDTTDAWRLAKPSNRIAISAAGIIAEAVLAIIAAHIWFFSKPGLLNSIAFYMMVVSLISTIFINGNPLIKLDGYFVLIDWLKTPNLASRSTDYLKYLFLNRTLGIERISNPAATARDKRIYLAYGVAKTIYRLFLYAAIITGVYYKFNKFIGLILAFIAIGLFIVLPVLKGLNLVIKSRSQINVKWKAAIAGACLIVALTLPLFIPWSGKITFPCYMESARVIKITSPLDVTVRDVRIKKGDIVDEGEPMFKLDPVEVELALSKNLLKEKMIQNQIAIMKFNDQERSSVPIKELELRKVSIETEKLLKDREIAVTGVKAPFRAVVTDLDKRMGQGFKPGKAAIVGELKSIIDCQVLALAPEDAIHKVKPGQMVAIYFPAAGDKVYKSKVEKIKKFNEQDLRDSVFSSERGGPIATEKSSNSGGEEPLTSHYICSTSLKNSDRLPIGATGVFVIPGRPMSIMGRLFDAAAKTFNRESLI